MLGIALPPRKMFVEMVLLACVLAVVFLALHFYRTSGWGTGEGSNATPVSGKLEIGVAERASISIVYDNNPFDERLRTAWGFASYIDVDGVKILFDTGGDPNILLDNMAKLNIDVEEIQIIVLSHIHGDHTGSLFRVLDLNPTVKLYLPSSFPDEFKRRTRDHGCEVIEVKEPMKICNGVATTGELGTGIKEQSLILSTTRGITVVTGCAHPGITNIIQEAKELTGMTVHMVLGGFHLQGASENTVKSVIDQLRKEGVEKVAPCHCTGDRARAGFKEAFGEDYLEAGVGFETQTSRSHSTSAKVNRRAYTVWHLEEGFVG